MTDFAADPEYVALLETVRANPWDDAPRLILSDWLEERGHDERAEFIRAQVGAARTPLCGHAFVWNHPEGCHRCKLGRRSDQLFDVIRNGQWLFPPPAGITQRLTSDHAWQPADRDVSEAMYDRGFVAEIRLPCAAFMEHAAALFAFHPIARVTLTDLRPWLAGRPAHRSGWTCDPLDFPDIPWCVPRKIFRHMVPSDPGYTHYSKERRWFPAEERAIEVLSDAAVTYGRELAGLSRLPKPLLVQTSINGDPVWLNPRSGAVYARPLGAG